ASSKILVFTQILFIAMTVTQISLFERHCDESAVKRRTKKQSLRLLLMFFTNKPLRKAYRE
ncbi:MAG: Na+/melibiose symporter-like transporter, partial [Roseivirga sp.]